MARISNYIVFLKAGIKQHTDTLVRMSRTVSGWILKSAKQSVNVIHREKCHYSKCLLTQQQVKWRSPSKSKAVFQKWLCYPVHEINFSGERSFRQISSENDVQFLLSPSQINYILRANELSYKPVEFNGKNPSTVFKFESNQLASNTPCEDRRSAATCLQTNGHFFGVFDGHAGSACAQSVGERLFYYIAVSLMSQKTLEDIEFASEHMKPMLPIFQWHKHKDDHLYREGASLYIDHLRVYWQELINLDNKTGMSVDDAMVYAFQRLDSDISLEAQVPTDNEFLRNLTLQVAFSGATACVSHVDGVHLHIANAGDCRAILGVQNDSGAWSAVPLTADHNAFNKAELQRLHAEHPPSEKDTIVTDNRLLGILMPFRAFGDVLFKWSRELQKSVLQNACDLEPLNIYQYSPSNYHTPPYLSAEPEVTYHKLRPQDKFLIMASDGLWDMLESEQVVKLVANHLSENSLQEPKVSAQKRSLGKMYNLLLKRQSRKIPVPDQNIATHLIRHAIGSNEDGEIEQEKLATMLSLSEDLARMYRDDITVTVVFFNSSAIESYYKENTNS
ncbi:pyruvate dehydrogenase [acetyl-transferring]-phosphatase 2, mitochondrial-like isoform X2 [Xenopus laevis]|uniref:[Pyruvate dehydrogenase [acetyl-transferring]]-phosphatase 2, mitochondrial n=1 Tax=Xenopus laevis TaxID=8355 RepID=A0A8J1KIG6_XENLA|nr:pyruvate dehydrogenase [acetyl-transferring]-phosphatase 2, mitochondrial-like isoform X2 [Xenopus laevis]